MHATHHILNGKQNLILANFCEHLFPGHEIIKRFRVDDSFHVYHIVLQVETKMYPISLYSCLYSLTEGTKAILTNYA